MLWGLTYVLEVFVRVGRMSKGMTRQEIEERLHELARKYVETHDGKIVDQLYELTRELEKIEKLEKQ
jgi:hypothetical protein